MGEAKAAVNQARLAALNPMISSETFTTCAVEHGAITPQERETMLADATGMFGQAVNAHAVILRQQSSTHRFFAYLWDGLASKQVYLRDTRGDMPNEPERWGWTLTTQWDGNAKEYVPTYEPERVQLLGYVDDEYLYLIPKTLEQYLHGAAKAEDAAWAIDMTTLLRSCKAWAPFAPRRMIKAMCDGNCRRRSKG